MKGGTLSMVDKNNLDKVFQKHDFTDFKWIEPNQVVVSQWVRMKCTYGCKSYGRNASCPPNVPSVSDCRSFFNEYSSAVVFHQSKSVPKPEDRHKWTKQVNLKLLELEREVFLGGFPKTFLLFLDSCGLCDSCSGKRTECNQPKSSRPTPEGMAIDVFSTVGKLGYPIEVLSDYTQTMNRYAFLFIN
jgi:predicted metal-binding protein